MVDPDPPMFVVSCLILGALTIAQYRRNEINRFHKPLLEAGLAMSGLASVSTGSVAACLASLSVTIPIAVITCQLLSQVAEAGRQYLQVNGSSKLHGMLSGLHGQDLGCTYLEKA